MKYVYLEKELFIYFICDRPAINKIIRLDITNTKLNYVFLDDGASSWNTWFFLPNNFGSRICFDAKKTETGLNVQWLDRDYSEFLCFIATNYFSIREPKYLEHILCSQTKLEKRSPIDDLNYFIAKMNRGK